MSEPTQPTTDPEELDTDDDELDQGDDDDQGDDTGTVSDPWVTAEGDTEQVTPPGIDGPGGGESPVLP